MSKTKADKIHLSHIIAKLENLPITKEVLVAQIRKGAAAAKRDAKTVHITWAGNFNLLVYPTGHFQIIPLLSFKCYELISETHCKEI